MVRYAEDVETLVITNILSRYEYVRYLLYINNTIQ